MPERSGASYISVESTKSQPKIVLQGSWRIAHLPEISAQIKNTKIPVEAKREIDGSRLEEIDTASAMLLFKYLLPPGQLRDRAQFTGFSEEHAHIFDLVRKSAAQPAPLREPEELGYLARLGLAMMHLLEILTGLTAFVGQSTVEIGKTAARPKLLRVKELVAQMEINGVDAIPIVCLVTFLIGIVLAYLFGIQIEKYGGNIFIVDATGLAMCRELSPILVAIILAGRSGSAFTAQIGTMKLNEELDAMTTIGLSPMRVLVLPRVFALVICMPLLVFIGDAVGIMGSMVVADVRLGITSTTFLERLRAVLPVHSFFVGLLKAPVFAVVIAMIGCRMGLNVENNARSVGLSTTSTVVRSIVAVILLNALFAVIFQELKI